MHQAVMANHQSIVLSFELLWSFEASTGFQH